MFERGFADLSMSKDTDDGTIFLDALEFAGDRRAAGLRMLLGEFGASLLLALVPVLVEAALDLVAEMLGPDGGERTEAAGGFDVANEADDDHLRGMSVIKLLSMRGI